MAPRKSPMTTLAVLFLATALAASAQQTPACSPGNSTEAAALLAFKDGLTSATALADWTSGSKAWTGVGCDADGRVVSLELYVRQLAGPVAWDALAQLSRLQTLHLGSNQLAGSVNLTGLSPTLTRVVLSDNQFGASLPDPWVLPTGLRTLDLSSNGLWGPLPDTVLWPTSLAELDLSSNIFLSQVPDAWEVPTSLTLLSLYSNYLTGTLPLWPNRQSLRVPIEPQTVALDGQTTAFCGEVPSSPQYLNVSKPSWAQLTTLPGCNTSSTGSSAAVSYSPAYAIAPDGSMGSNFSEGDLPPGPSMALPTPEAPPSTSNVSGGGTGEELSDGALWSPPPAAVATPTAPVAKLEPTSLDTTTAALLNFKYSLSENSTLGTPLAGWTQTVSPCDWRGVTCDSQDGEEQVTQIDLTVWGLQGHIAWDQLSKLPSLQILNLLNNSLSGPLGPVLPANLTQLDVSQNELSGGLPPSLPARLRELRAASNQLNGSIPQTWGNSTALRLVDISGNSINGTLPSWPDLQDLTMFVESQSGAGLCGQVPEQPRYLGVTELPSCDNLSPSPSPVPSPPPSPIPVEPSDSGVSAGVLVGAIVGGIVALALLALVGRWMWRRRRQPGLPTKHTPGEKVDPSNGVASSLEGDGKQPSDTLGELKWQLGTKALALGKSKDAYGVPAAQRSASSEVGTPQSAASLQLPPGALPNVHKSNDSAQQRSNTPDSTAPTSPTVAGQDGGCRGDSAESLTMQKDSGSGCSGVDVTPWLFRYGDFDLIKPIGEGSYARVYLARWRETLVAVKVFMVRGLEEEDLMNVGLTLSNPVLDNLRKESTLMASLRHPNIVSFMGVCAEPPCLVSEFCHRGSLARVLSQAAAAPAPAAALSWQKRLQLLLDAAKGMHYLHAHEPPVIHRDLKSPNLLVDKHWHGKISDFNLSKVMHLEGNIAQSSQTINNPRWLSPEILAGGTSTTASDVFAFGIVMWECMTFSLPWTDQSTWQIVNAVVGGERPRTPEYSQLQGGTFAGIDAYVQLMQQCWAQDPAARPIFTDITQQLRQLLLQCAGARAEPTE